MGRFRLLKNPVLGSTSPNGATRSVLKSTTRRAMRQKWSGDISKHLTAWSLGYPERDLMLSKSKSFFNFHSYFNKIKPIIYYNKKNFKFSFSDGSRMRWPELTGSCAVSWSDNLKFFNLTIFNFSAVSHCCSYDSWDRNSSSIF